MKSRNQPDDEVVPSGHPIVRLWVGPAKLSDKRAMPMDRLAYDVVAISSELLHFYVPLSVAEFGYSMDGCVRGSAAV